MKTWIAARAALVRRLRRALAGRALSAAAHRNKAAADRLDAAVREVLRR